MIDEYHLISTDESGDTSPTGASGTLMTTALTNNALWFLEQFEGVKSLPYMDGKGYSSVGIGYKLQNDPFIENIYLSNELNISQGSIYTALRGDLDATYTDTVVNGKVTVSAKTKLIDKLNSDYGGTLPSLNAAQQKDMWVRVVLSTNPNSQGNRGQSRLSTMPASRKCTPPPVLLTHPDRNNRYRCA